MRSQPLHFAKYGTCPLLSRLHSGSLAAVVHDRFHVFKHLNEAVDKARLRKAMIQEIKADARGFRNFLNYRTRVLFFCGKLDLFPFLTH